MNKKDLSESDIKAIVKKIDFLMQKYITLAIEIKQSKTYVEQLMQAVIKEAFEPNKSMEVS